MRYFQDTFRSNSLSLVQVDAQVQLENVDAVQPIDDDCEQCNDHDHADNASDNDSDNETDDESNQKSDDEHDHDASDASDDEDDDILASDGHDGSGDWPSQGESMQCFIQECNTGYYAA